MLQHLIAFATSRKTCCNISNRLLQHRKIHHILQHNPPWSVDPVALVCEGAWPPWRSLSPARPHLQRVFHRRETPDHRGFHSRETPHYRGVRLDQLCRHGRQGRKVSECNGKKRTRTACGQAGPRGRKADSEGVRRPTASGRQGAASGQRAAASSSGRRETT
jgi:hypothetical protein